MSSEKKPNALCDAVEAGDIEAVKALLKEKTIPIDEFRHDCGETSYTCYDEYGDPYTSTSTYSIRYNPLHLAAKLGKLEMIELLIEHGADKTITTWDKGDLHSNTALHLATKFADVPTVQLLCKLGFDVNYMGSVKRTPLHMALSRGDLDIFKALLDCGADLSIANELDRTPLDEACQYGKLDFIMLLVEKGANLNRQSTHQVVNDYSSYASAAGWGGVLGPKNVFTPLHLAVKNGHAPIVGYLLDKGANIEALANDGQYQDQTSLHLAYRMKHLTIVELLLERGANPNALDKHNHAPMYYLDNN